MNDKKNVIDPFPEEFATYHKQELCSTRHYGVI